jgi:3-hydroxyacyl-[acyl-carrier-protein] dehydratase
MKNYLLDIGFYRILNSQFAGGDSFLIATIEFNKGHSIFESHFPGFPVAPGVCICQIAQELLQISLNKGIRLISGKNIKFLEIINPLESGIVIFEIKYALQSEGNISTQIIVKNDERLFSKLSLSFVFAHE